MVCLAVNDPSRCSSIEIDSTHTVIRSKRGPFLPTSVSILTDSTLGTSRSSRNNRVCLPVCVTIRAVGIFTPLLFGAVSDGMDFTNVDLHGSFYFCTRCAVDLHRCHTGHLHAFD